MNPTARLILLTIVWIAIVSNIVNVGLLIVILRRLRVYHLVKMQQSADLMVMQQKLNEFVTSAVGDKVASASAKIDKLVAHGPSDVIEKLDTLIAKDTSILDRP